MMNQQGSPLHAASCNEDAPMGMGNVAGDGVPLPDEPWNEEPDDLDIADLPVALRAMVSLQNLIPALHINYNTPPVIRAIVLFVILIKFNGLGWWFGLASTRPRDVEESLEEPTGREARLEFIVIGWW
jgi:hypothetical protein